MKIRTVLSFIQQIQKLEQDKNFVYFFRGHSKKTFSIQPSIYRENNWINSEDILFKELVSHNPEEFKECQSAMEFLVKMQHYSLPTRLLDLTTNPLIALYFAACEFDNNGGEVLVFKIPRKDIKYYDSDTVSVLANISKCSNKFECDDTLDLMNFNEEEHIGLLLHQIGTEKPHFKRVIDPKDINRVLCVKVKQNNPRIINQSGAFLLFGINKVKGVMALRPKVLILDEPTAGLDPKGREDILREIRRYHKETGRTVLLVSHSMEDMANCAEKILVMNAGKVFCYDTVENVFRQAKALQEIGLAVPQITRVCMQLREQGIPLSDDIYTVEAAYQQILQLYRQQKEGTEC